MRDISSKVSSLREARATSFLQVSPDTLSMVAANQTPKKDVLVVARTAALMGVKKTTDLIPYCHPIAIDAAEVSLTLTEGGIAIEARVSTIGKTGVEMEALTACAVAALNLYDLLKPVDKHMVIGETKLISKTGGKSYFLEKISKNTKICILVTSDGVQSMKKQDRAGIAVKDRFLAMGICPDYQVISSQGEEISEKLLLLSKNKISLVLTIGGTGLNSYDVTADVTADICHRNIPGIMHRLQEYGQNRTPYAMFSRGIAGLIDQTLVINFPGSRSGAIESFDSLFPYLFHALPMLFRESSKGEFL